MLRHPMDNARPAVDCHQQCLSSSQVGAMAVRYVLALQAGALLASGASWAGVWSCPCQQTIRTAAFWTAVVVSQAAVALGLVALRLK